MKRSTAGTTLLILAIAILLLVRPITSALKVRSSVGAIAVMQNIRPLLFEYSAEHASLPSDIDQLLSWRALLTEHTSESIGFECVLDEPWDSPRNIKAAEAVSELWSEYPPQHGNLPITSVVAFAGLGTPFSNPGSSLQDLPASLVLLISIKDSTVNCFEPRDINLISLDDQLLPMEDVCNMHSFTVLFADGSIWVVSGSVPQSTFAQLCTVGAAAKLDKSVFLDQWVLEKTTF